MNKKLFKEADLSNFNFPDKTKIFVNESLCGYYRGLWGKCKKLYDSELIASFYVLNGRIRIRLSENGNAISITHGNDLIKHVDGINGIDDLSNL